MTPHEKDLERRLRIYLWTGIFLGLLAVILGLCSLKLASDKRTVINEFHNPIAGQGKDGIDGKNGTDGQNGEKGADGRTVLIPTSQPTIIHEEGPKGDTGTPGKDGAQGPAGIPAPVQEIQYNPDTGNLEKKYSTDRFWQVLIPCEVLKSCPTL